MSNTRKECCRKFHIRGNRTKLEDKALIKQELIRVGHTSKREELKKRIYRRRAVVMISNTPYHLQMHSRV